MERPGTAPTILVVEDYRDSRQMLRALLEGMNYCVLTAANGNEALDVARNNHIDMVLTDYGVPDFNGVELIERLRNMGGSFSRLPIVMLTAFDDEEYRRGATKAGCNAFFVKPADYDRLSETIRSLLNREGSNGS